MPTQTILHKNCLSLSDPERFDVLIVDPPYSAHVHANAVSQSVGGGVRVRDLGFDALTPELQAHIALCAAKVSRWSLIYSDIEGLHAWREAAAQAKATYIRHIPWIRWSMPQLSGDRPPSGCEFVTAFYGAKKGRKSWNGPGNLLCLQHTCLRGDGKHKAEKPLDQALDLVSWFSEPGESVLDLGAGSGTIGLACRILGRSYVGYEIDPTWAEFATKRISTAVLSARDDQRYTRWLETQKAAEKDEERRKENTDRMRAKLEAEKERINDPFEL